MLAISTGSVIRTNNIPSGKQVREFRGANICSLYVWQISLPISERQMRTHATDVAGFDERTGQPTTEKRKSRTSVLLSVVGEPKCS